MILTKADIENIASNVLTNFQEVMGIYELFTPIDQLATDYLGFKVIFERISDDENLCGLTAYADTFLKLQVGGLEKIVKIQKNQIVLNKSFIELSRIKELCNKRRFTLAHEVAHQILFSIKKEDEKSQYQKSYSLRVAHTPRELKTLEDWDEWQANYLGAALLIPKESVEIIVTALDDSTTKYEKDSYVYREYLIDLCTDMFHVSRSVAMIRLKNLGYISDIQLECKGGSNVKNIHLCAVG